MRIALTLLTCLTAVMLDGTVKASASASASASPKSIRGKITNIHVVPCGTVAALFCTESTVRGDLEGTSFSAVTSIVPSQTPGVLFTNATITLTFANGDVIHNRGSGISNSSPTSHGESILLGELMGGTGRFAAVSGYLQVRSIFSASSGIPGSGDYEGMLVLP